MATPHPQQTAQPRRTHRIVEGLATIRRSPEKPRGTVVLVHGAMDRAKSFVRTMRRLDDFDVLAYDRRGYAGSSGLGAATSIADHVADLRAICEWARTGSRPGLPLVLVGHSLGGLVVLLAACDSALRTSFHDLRSVGAYEAPMPWRTAADGRLPGNAALSVARRDGASAAAEFFYRAMVGDAVWNRLGDKARGERLAEGPALVSDLEHSREPQADPDIERIETDAHIARGERSAPQLRDVAGLWARRLGVDPEDLAGAGHGAHLSHPGEFASWIRSAARVEDG